MANQAYTEARRLGLKAYRQNLRSGEHPYLPILDDILSFTETSGERELGLLEIPLNRIVGTKSVGRTRAFASNFMPLLEEKSEFASKWSTLYEHHVERGITDPIVVVEYMNRYYVIEGNKRVSVLKYFNAVAIDAYVTRIMPVKSDDENVRAYYEFLYFQDFSRVNCVEFTSPQDYHTLCKLLNREYGSEWDRDFSKQFNSYFRFFERSFMLKGGGGLTISSSKAFLEYLKIYNYQDLHNKSSFELDDELDKLWSTLEYPPDEEGPSIKEEPAEDAPTVIRKLFPVSQLKIGFIFYKDHSVSGWSASHNLGKMYLDEALKEVVTTFTYEHVLDNASCEAAIDQAISDGCTVIFTTSPRFLGASIRASVKYPDIKFFNCSLNVNSGYLRTYYGRMYEAKFLVGMLAGILSDTNHIGYLADFPIVGVPADINAFALGVQTVNPQATVHLSWSTLKDMDYEKFFRDNNVSHISGRDTISPLFSNRPYGLYSFNTPSETMLASSIWHWGKFYLRIVQSILNGKWSRRPGDEDSYSVNYWWGMSSGMIDFIYSSTVPDRTVNLLKLMKKTIASGNYNIFSGRLFDNCGGFIHDSDTPMTAEEIINMDSLYENVRGSFPSLDILTDEALEMVEIQGIITDENTGDC